MYSMIYEPPIKCIATLLEYLPPRTLYYEKGKKEDEIVGHKNERTFTLNPKVQSRMRALFSYKNPSQEQMSPL